MKNLGKHRIKSMNTIDPVGEHNLEPLARDKEVPKDY